MTTNLNLLRDGIVTKSPTFSSSKYTAFFLNSVSGITYITANSPHYMFGNLSLKARHGGRYPYGYKKMINELFGDSSSLNLIEVCAGSISPGFNLYTVDINPDKYPSLVGDGQSLPAELSNTFDRWSCDPPYNHETAAKMYGTELPSFSKLIAAGAKVVKVGGLLFLLLGNKNLQKCPACLTKIGMFFCSMIPNQEVRSLNIFYKHSD